MQPLQGPEAAPPSRIERGYANYALGLLVLLYVINYVDRQVLAVLLEPIMRVEVVTPDDYTGDVIGDLSARTASIAGIEIRNGSGQSIQADVPLKLVQELMNHLDIKSTLRYAHLAPHQKCSAIEQMENGRKIGPVLSERLYGYLINEDTRDCNS